MSEKKTLSDAEMLEALDTISERWKDPVSRMQDTFNIRDPLGRLKPYVVPEPQKQIIRDGILGKARGKIKSGVSHITVINKGRQMGFSVFNAAEAILIAQDFPNSMVYYVATTEGQAKDWMNKLNQLVQDSNHYPEELGGGPILNIVSIKNIYEKNINDTYIVGLAASPSGIRGKTAIAVYFDEAAWAIRTKELAGETWKALSYFISQGGQGRIQSTPRTSDSQEFFWKQYQLACDKKGGMVAYECPVIENWQELDLDEPLYIELNDEKRDKYMLSELTPMEKHNLREYYKDKNNFIVTDDYIKQNAKVLYPWKTLFELENDRLRDKQQFMQEYLCQPIDETLKVIQSEWIENNLVEEPQYSDRGDSINPFYMCIDVAHIRDVTAIIVTEKVKFNKVPIYKERFKIQFQDEAPVQAQKIFDLYRKFMPEFVAIDATGCGIPVVQYLKKLFRENGFNPMVIKETTFTQNLKEQMATSFRDLCQPNAGLSEIIYDMNNNPITVHRNRYRFLRDKNNKDHQDLINHVKRVEREMLPQGGTRYSGKRYGRDDGFWASAMLTLYEKSDSHIKAGFGATKVFSTKIDTMTKKKSVGQEHIENINKKRFETKREQELRHKYESEKYKMMSEKREYTRRLKIAYDCLLNSKNICSTQKRIVNPIECASEECSNPDCQSYKYVLEISNRYNVTIDDIYHIYKKLNR